MTGATPALKRRVLPLHAEATLSPGFP